MARRKDRTRHIRFAVAAAAGAVVVLVAGIGLFYQGADEQPYRTVDLPDGTGTVTVVEYFSYLCPHCRSFEEAAEGWAETLPQGAAFERVHVAFTPATRILAKGHAALVRRDAIDANHARIFRAIQDRNRQFTSIEALADFVDGNGVDRDAFLRTASSPRIGQMVDAREREFVELGLTNVPALVVDGKHVINMALGRKQALDAAHELASDLAAERQAG